MTRVGRGAAVVAALGVFGLLGGCQHRPANGAAPTRAHFHLEEPAGSADGVPFILPRSEVRIVVGDLPVFTTADFARVAAAEVELGRCLLFELTGEASQDLSRLTASAQGRRLVLLVDGVALGARRIDTVFTDGRILIFAEVPNDRLVELANSIAAGSLAGRKKSDRIP